MQSIRSRVYLSLSSGQWNSSLSRFLHGGEELVPCLVLVRIHQPVSGVQVILGEHLSVNSTLLELARMQYKDNMKECCKRVFGFWLNGAGKRPITWSTVLDALRAVGLVPLADSVLQQLQNWY